jgi:hypothetical protein
MSFAKRMRKVTTINVGLKTFKIELGKRRRGISRFWSHDGQWAIVVFPKSGEVPAHIELLDVDGNPCGGWYSATRAGMERAKNMMVLKTMPGGG